MRAAHQPLALLTVSVVLLIATMLPGCGRKLVKPDIAPVITNVAVAPASVNPGGTATVTVEATDPDGDALTYTYTLAGDAGTITGTGASVTWTLPTTPGPYQVSVKASAKGLDSANSTATCTVTTAPAIASSLPAPDATEVSPKTLIVIRFSKPMKPGTVAATLTPPDVTLGPAVYSRNDSVSTFTPTAPLALGTTYTVSVSGSDTTGNALAAPNSFRFTTASAPTIVSTLPADRATGVKLNSTVVVTFSKAMNPATVTANLSPAESLGTRVMSAGNTVATFTPVANLTADTPYALIVSGTSVGGLSLLGDTTFHFTTGTALDQPPVIDAIEVLPASVNLSGTTTVRVTASDPEGDALTYAYKVTGGTISGTGATVTWTLPATPGTDTVSVMVRDESGLIATQQDTCVVTAPPTIVKFSPADNSIVDLRQSPADPSLVVVVTFSRAMNPTTVSFGGGQYNITLSAGNTVATGVWQLGPDVAGDFTVTVSAQDLDGVSPSGQNTFHFTRVLPAGGGIRISKGHFTLGSPSFEVDRGNNEGPLTTVTLTHDFFLDSTEVTQAQYLAVMGSNPSVFTGDLTRPVEHVTWDDAVKYCKALTDAERTALRCPTSWGYRLPTEAEWEYAARADGPTRFSYGDDPGYTLLTQYSWYAANSAGTTHPVGGKAPNKWGLYDMYGNVEEWCKDWYAGTYPGGSVFDPTGPTNGPFHVFRGGSWRAGGKYCRSAQRSDYGSPPTLVDDIGFRVVLARDQP